MPSISKAQRAVFAIAEHHPEKLYSRNKNLADLPHKTLHDFAATNTKDLPEHVPVRKPTLYSRGSRP